ITPPPRFAASPRFSDGRHRRQISRSGSMIVGRTLALKGGRLRRAGPSSARTHLDSTIPISRRDLTTLSSRSDDPSRRVRRALKGRLGHYARPEGRGERFRAGAFAELAPLAALSHAFSARI